METKSSNKLTRVTYSKQITLAPSERKSATFDNFKSPGGSLVAVYLSDGSEYCLTKIRSGSTGTFLVYNLSSTDSLNPNIIFRL